MYFSSHYNENVFLSIKQKAPSQVLFYMLRLYSEIRTFFAKNPNEEF